VRALLAGSLLVACSGGGAPPEDPTGDTGAVDTSVPCYPHGDPTLEVGEGGEGWGIDGVAIETGIPPQGGAPYARFRVRVANLDLHEGADVRVDLFTAGSDMQLGTVAVAAGFVCANVGENADHWVTPEVHVRFDGADLLDLHEVPVDIEASVVGVEGSVARSGDGVLMVDERYLQVR